MDTVRKEIRTSLLWPSRLNEGDVGGPKWIPANGAGCLIAERP